MTSYDVVVVGLGAMGSGAAMHLARRGQRILGLDRYAPPHNLGSTHGHSRVTRCAYYEGPDYVPLAQRAWDQWLALGKDQGEEVLTPTGCLSMGPAGSEVVEGARLSAERYDLDHEVLDGREVARRWPVFRPRPDHLAVYELQGGLVRPEAGVAAMLATAAAAGAELRTGTPVVGWEAGADSVRVTLPDGETVEAGTLVLSVGPWAPEMLAEAKIPMAAERQVQFWFEPPSGALLSHPVFMHESATGTLTYGAPAHAACGTKVGLHYGGAACTPDTIDREVTVAEVNTMRDVLGEFAPGLAGKLQNTDTCMYTNTPDKHFVIGPHPGHPRVALAAGFSGHGFKFAPVVGEILADLATTGTTPLPIGLFDPGRFTRS